MPTEKYLALLQKKIHTAVVATVDQNQLPVTCVIDMMLSDADGLYFLTAKGKSFYERLKRNAHISITGFQGRDTMSSQAISLKGKVREIGQERLAEIFQQNPYMNEIYPDAESRTVLRVFQVYEGEGEFFDLSKKPIYRESFSFGNAQIHTIRYIVNDRCSGCGRCAAVCPQKCIDETVVPYVINPFHCLHCGRCIEACVYGAVEKRDL